MEIFFVPVAASAGNHAQGIALVMSYLGRQGLVGDGKRLGQAQIYMPTVTPKVKQDAVKILGGEFVNIRLMGDTFNETRIKVGLLVLDDKKLEEIHPYNGPLVIAGQGGIGLEIFSQLQPDSKVKNFTEFQKDVEIDGVVVPDLIMAPCGGGGLISGIAITCEGMGAHTKLIAVEPDYVASAFLISALAIAAKSLIMLLLPNNPSICATASAEISFSLPL